MEVRWGLKLFWYPDYGRGGGWSQLSGSTGLLIKYPDKVIEKRWRRQVASQIMYSAEALDNLTTSGVKPTPSGCFIGTTGSQRIYMPVSKSWFIAQVKYYPTSYPQKLKSTGALSLLTWQLQLRAKAKSCLNNVENGATRHTHDTSFVQIESEMRSWFGHMAPALGMGLSLETRFGFRYTVWLWAFGLYVRETIANAGMRDSFGIVKLSGKPGERPGETRKHCNTSVRGLEAGGGKVFVFFLVTRKCSRGKERLTWSSVTPHGWIWWLCDWYILLWSPSVS